MTKQDKDENIQQLQLDLHDSRKYRRQLEDDSVDLYSNAKYFKDRAAKSDKFFN